MTQMPRHIEDVAARARLYMRQGRPLGLQVVWHSSLLFPCHLLLSPIPLSLIHSYLIRSSLILSPFVPFFSFHHFLCVSILISGAGAGKCRVREATGWKHLGSVLWIIVNAGADLILVLILMLNFGIAKLMMLMLMLMTGMLSMRSCWCKGKEQQVCNSQKGKE